MDQQFALFHLFVRCKQIYLVVVFIERFHTMQAQFWTITGVKDIVFSHIITSQWIRVTDPVVALKE